MKCIDINANIPNEKKPECYQNKIQFINELTNQDGYVDFKEDLRKDFHIVITIEDEKKCNEFMNSDHFHFFQGALKTISHNIEIKTYSTEI